MLLSAVTVLTVFIAAQSCAGSSFRPTFPAGCPFITSVGATSGVAPEIAADLSSGIVLLIV